jgi:hypothetical protein
MTREEAIVISTIPSIVLRQIIGMLIAGESTGKVVNHLLTQPRGDLQYAPMIVVHGIVTLLRQWVALLTSANGGHTPGGVTSGIATWLREHARKVAGGDGPPAGSDTLQQGWDGIDEFTLQLSAVSEATKKMKPAEYAQVADTTLHLEELVENKDAIAKLEEQRAQALERKRLVDAYRQKLEEQKKAEEQKAASPSAPPEPPK